MSTPFLEIILLFAGGLFVLFVLGVAIFCAIFGKNGKNISGSVSKRTEAASDCIKYMHSENLLLPVPIQASTKNKADVVDIIRAMHTVNCLSADD